MNFWTKNEDFEQLFGDDNVDFYREKDKSSGNLRDAINHNRGDKITGLTKIDLQEFLWRLMIVFQ